MACKECKSTNLGENEFCDEHCRRDYYSKKKDNINPDHYKFGGIETFDYLKAKLSPTQLAGFCKGNIIKYVSRADHKNKVEDLLKCHWYLTSLIEIEYDVLDNNQKLKYEKKVRKMSELKKS